MARAKVKRAAKTSTRPAAAKRRASTKPKKAKRAKVKAKSRPKHRFTASHHREEDFASGGLRDYAKYRDLGVSEATEGMVQAHVIRFIPPCIPEEVSKRHYHDVDFQLVYVLRGWLKTEIEGQGELLMEAGSCWIQPPGIEHAVTDYSDDCEVLEVILPADFETVMLE